MGVAGYAELVEAGHLLIGLSFRKVGQSELACGRSRPGSSAGFGGSHGNFSGLSVAGGWYSLESEANYTRITLRRGRVSASGCGLLLGSVSFQMDFVTWGATPAALARRLRSKGRR